MLRPLLSASACALLLAAASARAADRPPDSKSWEGVMTRGPALPANAAARDAKLAALAALARGERARAGAPAAVLPAPRPHQPPVRAQRAKPPEVSTAAPLTGDALARSLAQERAKLERARAAAARKGR